MKNPLKGFSSTPAVVKPTTVEDIIAPIQATIDSLSHLHREKIELIGANEATIESLKKTNQEALAEAEKATKIAMNLANILK